jgi:hypothetical protein
MRIKVKELIKHGRERYEAGDERTVDDELGAYFVENGWAAEVGGADVDPLPHAVTLDVKSGKHGVKDSNHG